MRRKAPASRNEKAVLVLITLLLILVVSGLGRALGDDRVPAHSARGGHRAEPLYVVLARFLCGEADHHAQDYAALLWTMRRRADTAGLSLRAMVFGYSMPLLGHGGARGVWVRALPDAFPTHAYRGTWDRAVKYAQTFLRGELSDPCVSATNHFGSPQDVALRYPHAVRVECSSVPGAPTVNVYFLE